MVKNSFIEKTYDVGTKHKEENFLEIYIFQVSCPLSLPLVLNKTYRLPSARTFVRLYRLLFIHCIYVSVTKPTCLAFSAWLNTGAVRSLKVTGKAIILCRYGITIKVTCMCSTIWPIKYWFNVWFASHTER